MIEIFILQICPLLVLGGELFPYPVSISHILLNDAKRSFLLLTDTMGSGFLVIKNNVVTLGTIYNQCTFKWKREFTALMANYTITLTVSGKNKYN